MQKIWYAIEIINFVYEHVKSDRKRYQSKQQTEVVGYILTQEIIVSAKMAADNGQRTTEVVRGQVFEVGPRYTSLSYIGEGAYGMVV